MIRLHGLTWQHPRGYNPLVATAAAYHQLHPDVKIDWDQLPWSEFWRTSHAEMGARTGRYDLYMVDHPWVGDYSSRGWLIPLDSWLTPSEKADLEGDVDSASYRSYIWNRHLWALPVDASCHVVVFRPDLVGTDCLPLDWDALLDLARGIHTPPQRYAFTVPWEGGWANAVLFFLALLAAAGQRPFEDRGRLEIDPDVGRQALKIIKQIWNMSLPAARLHHRRGEELLLQEDVAAISVSSFAYINYFGRGGPRRLAVTDCPMLPLTGIKTSILGGMGLGISVDCHHPDLAWDYAWFVMSRDVQGGIYVDNDGQPGRLSALSNPAIDAQKDGFCTVLRKALTDCYVRPRYPGWLAIENGAAPALARYLAGSFTDDDVFRFFNEQARTVWT